MSQAASGAWFFAQRGQQYGPVPIDDLRQRLAGGQLTADDLVWQEGMTDWQPIGSMPHLFATAVTATGFAPAPAPIGYAAPMEYARPHTRYAGFWWRVLAAIIDGLITGAAGAIIGGVIGGVIGAAAGTSQDTLTAIQLITNAISLIGGWLYYALMESSSNQATLGKMACGLYVTDLNGARISFGRATGRHFAKYISGFILCIGFMMAGFTQRKQALHDMIANTLVMKK